jgi:prepilin-type N-terminal cleavage/methylation domain-containing protein
VFSTFKRLKAKKADQGLTLIELLIVIVILGILSATIVFAVGGMTSNSAKAACETDYATVSTAIDAFNAQNPGVPLTLSALTGSGPAGGPYISALPSNGTHYTFAITGGALTMTTGGTGGTGGTAVALTANETASEACATVS